MSDRPEPLSRLDLLFIASRIAHEAIFDMHRELASLGSDDGSSRDHLAESARIVLEALPHVTAEARRLAAQWEAQSLLDPDGADRTLQRLEGELERIAPDLRRLRTRQREIAGSLRSRVAEERER